MTGSQGRRCRMLMDDVKERIVFWKLKEDALDGKLGRTHSVRAYGPVVRQSTE